MAWNDFIPKVPSVEEITEGVKKGMDVLKGDKDEGQSTPEASQSQEPTDLEQLTAMLNDPEQGPMFEQQFNMDISGAKKNDGVVTKDEAVVIVSKFSETLVDKGYLKDVSASEKKSHEAELRQELGDEVGSYDQLSADQKDALLIFIVTPEAQKQEAIQKAAKDGAFSYAPTDDAEQDHNVVRIDGDGNITNFERTDMTKTQAYTTFPEVPPFIADNELG